MSIILLLFLSSIMIWILRVNLPVRQLTFVNQSILKDTSDQVKTMKMLDVRDAVDYEHCHVEGSINISLGRLPFVWEKELSSDDSVLILSRSRYQSKKAARILKNHGFNRLYAMHELNCA